MHRMIFEDIKNLSPGLEIHFACPAQYHPAVQDHPFVDKLLDSRSVDPYDYMVSYNTTTACGRYEMMAGSKSDLNRSDIWAKYCGINLTHHNMHIRLTDGEREAGRHQIELINITGRPSVCFCPKSAMISKDLYLDQMVGVVRGLRERGFFVFGMHREPIEEFIQCGLATILNPPLRTWMAVIDQTDAVISVDTSSFHCAGGLNQRLVGVFGWADGKVYGKHYDFVLVQKHRDNGDWNCGPCYTHGACPKCTGPVKPCMTELTFDNILTGFDQLMETRPLSYSRET